METRSQAKQHEIREEQLSKLLAMMTTVQKQQTKQEQLAQEHKVDLEKLSKDHKADLEKVVRAQQEQAERQEDLARDQETKWLQFMEKQDKRCLEIEQKQSVAETTVQALRHDISLMKDVLQSRITTTEEGLEELQTKLTSKLHATKTAIMHELIGELEHVATKSHLKRYLRQLISCGLLLLSLFFSHHYSESPRSSPEASTTGASPLQKSTPFDGRFLWDTYKLQFEMLANEDHWSDVETAAYLAVSLRWSALTMLTNVHPDHQGVYATLVAALNK